MLNLLQPPFDVRKRFAVRHIVYNDYSVRAAIVSINNNRNMAYI